MGDHVPGDEAVERRIRDGLFETYFREYDPAFLRTEAGKADVTAHVRRRYEDGVTRVLPWLRRVVAARGEAVEIGCGTGSSTAALSRMFDRVTGYDIHRPSVEGALRRLAAMEIRNAQVHVAAAESMASMIRSRHAPGTVAAFVMHAVLEHQTTSERLDTIALGWDLLAPGGVFVVVETPNRLVYLDDHTSQLPFFHLLPDELAARYASHSPRPEFRDPLLELARRSPGEVPLALTRHGRGVSYHDLEVVLGDLGPLVAASGFEPEILAWFPMRLDEELLRAYFVAAAVPAPLAFTRCVLNFVLRKPGPGVPAPAPAAPPGGTTAGGSAEAARLAARVRELEAEVGQLRGRLAIRLAEELKRAFPSGAAALSARVRKVLARLGRG